MQQQPPSSVQFGASPPPDAPPFSISAAAGSQLAEAAFPISSRPPPPADAVAGGSGEAGSNFDELALGEEGGGAPGNRWPRQETLALLKIRSEMDAAFREATFKGPLWEEVSRKLAELGYKRSAKKCKEKFENVHKYYKRTKDGRAGRQDGKTYRFFSQLEALHNSGGSGAITPPAAAPTTISFATAMAGPPSTASIQPLPVSAVAPSAIAMPSRIVPELGPQGISTPGGGGISFSWNSSSSSESESDDEDTELEGGGSRELGRKRKRGGGGGGSRSRRRMMNFFEGLMKQVMERQEAMQQRFLEAIEKREQDRLIREEAWRRQEMAHLGREQELLAQERAMAASRDTAVISYLQRISGQSTPLLPTAAPATAATISIVPLAPEPTQSLPPPPPQPSPRPPPLQIPSSKQKPAAGLQQQDAQRPRPSPVPMQVVPIASEPAGEGHGSGVLEPPSSSRWPKGEVHALIQMRSGLDTRYQEAGPKGPLWEEISAGMKRLGYNRNAKRCKEKWENINKYFKKVKDSNKQRPEDAKTCPYFHQLEALYRKKLHGNGGAAIGAQQQRDQDASANHSTTPPSKPQPPQPPAEAEGHNNGGDSEAGGGSSAAQEQSSNGFFEEGTNKSEDAVKDLMSDFDKMDDEPDSENNLDQEDEDDEDDDEEDDENSKMQYKIQFQPQNVSGNGGGGGANGSTTANTTSATTAGSFMAMVQ